MEGGLVRESSADGIRYMWFEFRMVEASKTEAPSSVDACAISMFR